MPFISTFLIVLHLDIIDGNRKLTLGMIWTLILRFTIADIRLVNLAGVSLEMLINHYQRGRVVCQGGFTLLVSTKNGTI
jgi:hypothetical protein